jgi:hypothetical protein
MGPSLLSRIESALPQCAWKADGVLSLPLSKSFRNAARLEPCWMLSHQTASPASGGGPAIRHCSVQVAPALLPLDFGIVQAECSLAQTRTKFPLNRKKHLHMAPVYSGRSVTSSAAAWSSIRIPSRTSPAIEVLTRPQKLRRLELIPAFRTRVCEVEGLRVSALLTHEGTGSRLPRGGDRVSDEITQLECCNSGPKDVHLFAPHQMRR